MFISNQTGVHVGIRILLSFQALARWEGPKLIIEYKPKVEGQGKANTVTREIVKGQLVQVGILF